MVYLMNKITQIFMILLVILVGIAAVVFAIFFSRKNKRKKNSITEEEFVITQFNRKDMRDYVKHIEDIRGDMIITDGGNRFVAVLKCTGFDLFYESADRQLATVRGMYGFTNTITKPMTYRQFSKPVDLEYTLKRYQDALNARSEELFHVQEDIRDMESNLKRDKNALSDADVSLYEREIQAARKKEKALRFRCFHLQDELRALGKYTGGNMDPETVETWIYEWSYDPYDFTYDMSQEEIYYRAMKELYSIGRTKIHALANCGVRASRCTTDELIDMCRWYSAPVSAERYKLSDIKASSYFDDITGDNPLERAVKRAAAEIDEQAQMEFYQALKETADSADKEKQISAGTPAKPQGGKRMESVMPKKTELRKKHANTAVSAGHSVSARRAIVRSGDVRLTETELIGEY